MAVAQRTGEIRMVLELARAPAAWLGAGLSALGSHTARAMGTWAPHSDSSHSLGAPAPPCQSRSAHLFHYRNQLVHGCGADVPVEEAGLIVVLGDVLWLCLDKVNALGLEGLWEAQAGDDHARRIESQYQHRDIGFVKEFRQQGHVLLGADQFAPLVCLEFEDDERHRLQILDSDIRHDGHCPLSLGHSLLKTGRCQLVSELPEPRRIPVSQASGRDSLAFVFICWLGC